MGHRIPAPFAALAHLATALVVTMPAEAQELGHKALGTIGLHAGSQPERGIYLADRFLSYGARRVIDRDGRDIPIGLDLDALANGTGIQATFSLPRSSTYFNATFAAPLAHVSLQTDRPEASIDRFGLGDIYVQPIKLGWKMNRLDIVSGYGFYAPTGRVTPGGRGALGRGHWTHEFSLGSEVHVDRARTWHLSGLLSYELNRRKRDFDITRGDTMQIQGGAGKRVSGRVDAGLAGYALWQVRDDRGADLPQLLRGARERVFGLGPEIGVTLTSIRGRLIVRYCHDILVRARPLGHILVIGFTMPVSD